jgi:hypothetical protein
MNNFEKKASPSVEEVIGRIRDGKAPANMSEEYIEGLNLSEEDKEALRAFLPKKEEYRKAS